MDAAQTPAITSDMAGTWLDGNQGWHNHYRVVDKAVEFGWTVPEDYAADLATYRETGNASDGDVVEYIVGQGELADQATDYLNEKAPEDFEFTWDMGELSFLPTELDDEDTHEISTGTCDGIFLILDTAKHNGFGVKRSEIRAHVKDCESCQEHNSDLSWM